MVKEVLTPLVLHADRKDAGMQNNRIEISSSFSDTFICFTLNLAYFFLDLMLVSHNFK